MSSNGTNKFLTGISGIQGSTLAKSLLLMLVFFAVSADAAIPPAGIVVSSQSTAAYSMGSNDHTAASNEVQTTILPVFGPLLLPDGTVDTPAGVETAFSTETVTFPYNLTNSGNGDDSFDLATIVINPSDFIPQMMAVYLDMDGDGVIDTGENVITQASDLGSGETVSLILLAQLPAGLTGGESAHVDLTARSVSDTSMFDAGNVVRITARNEARVELVKSSDVPDALPGGLVTFTLAYTNTGERSATDILITDFIDYSGMTDGTVFVAGSALSSLPGVIEYYDGASMTWTQVEPPEENVKGVRLGLGELASGAGGDLSFTVRVDDDHLWGYMINEAAADFTGGDGLLYTLDSNEVLVLVRRVSELALGPVGYPDAPEGSVDDRVIVSLTPGDTSYTFWHELVNDGNYIDTVRIALADSSLIPSDWSAQFVDQAGVPLTHLSANIADIGAIDVGGSEIVGLRLESTPERFRQFSGRELDFLLEAFSAVDTLSRNSVRDVLIKTDMPLLSIGQAIREPNAMVGDILSFVITVENLTDETTVDSVAVVEQLSPGLGYAGGSLDPVIAGNTLSWNIGTMGPGERRDIVFRAAVKAGQERDELRNFAWVFGVSRLGERTSDGPALAAIRIIEGIFSRKGIVFGSVFHDSDGDGVRSGMEKGINGVSVYLETGTYAVTDSAGLYSMPGTNEGTHVVRIDPKTIPDSLEAASAGYFGLGVAGEYLIDLAPSGNRRVDFPLVLSARNSPGDTSAAIGGGPAAVAGELSGSTADFSGRGSIDTASAVESASARSESGPDTSGMGQAGQGGASGGEGIEDNGEYTAINIPSSYFMPGSAILEEIPIREVAGLGLWMMEHPGWRISIEGHTDSIPISTAEYPSNFELSLERARSVFQLLRMNGIPEEKMDYMGYGARVPVATNGTPEGRALNRRVEINVIAPDGYSDGDPGLPALLAMPDTTTREYLLADDAGICADIVKPDEGKIFSMRDKIDVEILTPLGSSVELYVNNIPVGREKIGQKQINIIEGTLGYIFYDVKISTGRNDILVVCRNHGERNVCVRHVYLSGKPAGIVAEREKVVVPADGRSVPRAVFLVKDKNGLPVRDGIFVTVTGPPEVIGALDVNPHQNGVQASTLNGKVTLTLPPSNDARTEKINVRVDGISGGCTLSYESPMHDWFLFGYGEADVGYSSLTGTGSTDRSAERHHDGLFAEGRISLFGQGEVKEGHLMTVAVDTRPLREDRLLPTIEPEKYYPVYGDASDLRFNTASRSGTFVSLDHRRYSAMFGDFKTDLGGLELSRYERTFNGLRGEAKLGRGNVKAFITRTDQVTYQEEIPADGTSGFYFLEHFPLIEHSEKVRIEVRDRYRPEEIIRIDNMQVLRDYDINYMDGSILFKEPVAAFDENLNPVTIVVGYECRDSGEVNFIYGMRSVYDVTDSLRIGATAILEDEGPRNSSLVGADLSGHLYRSVMIETEFVHSEKFLLGAGNAFRFKLSGSHAGTVKWNAYYRQIDDNFFNPSFTGGKTELGSTKAGADIDWMIDSRFSVTSKFFRHDFRQRDEKKGYFDVCGLYRRENMTAKAGLARASHSDLQDGSYASMLMIAGASLEKGRARGELQLDQKLSGEEVEEYPNRFQANLSYNLWKHLDGTLQHEYRTGRRSGSRHLTQLGIESKISEDLNVYSRYRMEGAVSGERGQAIMGVKNKFRLSDDLSSGFTAERQATVSGLKSDDYTMMGTSWLYTPKIRPYKLKGDYEVRFEPDRTKHLLGLAGLRKLGRRWSGLVKGDLWYSNEYSDIDRVKGSVTIGSAYRPRETGPLTVLSLVKTEYEKNSPAHPRAVDKDLMVMTEANYVLNTKWEIEGKWAGRWVRNTFQEYTYSTASFLYQTQLIRMLGGSWDMTFSARLVHQVETRTLRYGGGLEIGRIVAENVWIGCGYDYSGHRDGDSEINEFTRNGFHLGIKMKFNEKLLKYFYSGTD